MNALTLKFPRLDNVALVTPIPNGEPLDETKKRGRALLAECGFQMGVAYVGNSRLGILLPKKRKPSKQ